jgi:hypothetical protein
MGIDTCGVNILLPLLQNNTFKNVLTIGKQRINTFYLEKYGCNNHDYSEKLFKYFGSEIVHSIDASSYENCSIVQNLNKKVSLDLKYENLGNRIKYTKSMIFKNGKISKSNFKQWNEMIEKLRANYNQYIVINK